MARRLYNRKSWHYTRLRQLSDSPWCAHCGAPATQVDHVIPMEAGGLPFDSSNLQSLCQSCHSAKSAAQDGGYGNKRGKWKPKGCKPDGTPNDPDHPWNNEKNLPGHEPKDRARTREES